MIKFVIPVFVFVWSYQAVLCQDVVATAAPNATHHHYEPSENEGFSFIYEGATHQMLMMTAQKCYIFTLSSTERQNIHTDAGIRAVELRILKQVNHAYFTKVPGTVLHTNIVSQCYHYSGYTASHHHQHVDFYLVH